MILMPQIFDVTANENARYKRNELEWLFNVTINDISVIYVTARRCAYYGMTLVFVLGQIFLI